MTIRTMQFLLLILLFTLAGCISPIPTTPGTVPPVTETASATTPTVSATVTTTVTPAITSTATIPASGGEVGSCQWRAVHQVPASGSAQLRVTGTCVMPTPGYTLTLTRAAPQGINPSHLLLNLMATPPTDMVAQVLTPSEVGYEETTDMQYERVDIVSQVEIIQGESVVVEEAR